MEREEKLVDDPAALASVASAIANEPRIALDTESNGFHAYVERVCLVQIATPQASFAIDTLALSLDPLAALLKDPAREVTLHAAEYDVMSLRRDFNIRLGTIFDTHAAAKVLGIERVGLGNLLADQLGVSLEEDEQRSDWGRRPLSPEQITYAFADVRHLLELRDKLAAQLVERGHLAEAQAEFARLIERESKPREFDPEGWQRMKAARTLDGRGRGVLRELYLVRDRRARDLNRPPFKVLSDLFLAEVARRQPKTEEDLSRIPGASPQQIRKIAAQVLAAVEAGQSGAPPVRPKPAGPRRPFGRGSSGQSPEVEDRYEKLRAWRKARAEARKVEVQVIAPNAVLLAVAQSRPRDLHELARIAGMDEFRVRQYGAEMLAAIGDGS